MSFFEPKPFKLPKPEPMFKYEPAGWQVCPLYERSVKNHGDDCKVCEGKMIINKLTGKPPKD